LRADFVKLLCRTETFRSKVNALVVGHSGRKRVAPELMETMPVPVPSIEDQDRILSRFREQTTEARAIRERADYLEGTISQCVLLHLGITARPFHRIRRPFVVRAKDTNRWAVTKAMLTVQGVTEDVAGTYPNRRLGDPDVGIVSYGIQKSPSNRPGDHARPYLRVANVQAARLDLREIKMIDVPDEQMPHLRLEDGDLLLCEGNSEELVGRPAIWHNEIPDCVHQNHIIKVRVNRDLLDPEYVLAYMNTPPARLYFLGRAKRTTNLASINGTDVREMPIPVPPKPVQEAIIREVATVRDEVVQHRTQARRIQLQALAEVERAILAGSKK
jgi:type I restriction enzyme S subunit